MAYGVDPVSGERWLLDWERGRDEDEESWRKLLERLLARGLNAERGLELFVHDGSAGLEKAFEIVYFGQGVERQRCIFHKLRNVTKRVPKSIQAECLARAKKIYLANSRREAVAQFKEWAGKSREQVPDAVACIEKDLEELLSFFKCPKEDWRKVRTTNAIERSFREVRRRTRPMSCFNNNDSCRRILYGVFHHLNKHWQEHA